MAKPLRLVTWSARVALVHRAELAAFVTEYDLDVILLQETFLTPRVSFQLPVYVTYRTDRPYQNDPSGGTAILVHRHIAHRPLPLPATSPIEVTVVRLTF